MWPVPIVRCSPRLPPLPEPFRDVDDIYATAPEPRNDTVMGDSQKRQIYDLYDNGSSSFHRDAFFWISLGVISMEEKTKTPFFLNFFLEGCDTSTFIGEKSAGANVNSLRGFEEIDDIKTKVEAACPGVDSCANFHCLFRKFSLSLSMRLLPNSVFWMYVKEK